MQFDDRTTSVKLRYQTSELGFDNLLIKIACGEPDWQLSSIEQVCNSSLHLLSTVQDLCIEPQGCRLLVLWNKGSIEPESTLWFQLLLPFTAVKNFYLSREFAPGIAAALQQLVGGRITELLPSPQNIFVERFEPLGSFQRNLCQFVVARLLASHCITVFLWERQSNRKSRLSRCSPPCFLAFTFILYHSSRARRGLLLLDPPRLLLLYLGPIWEL